MDMRAGRHARSRGGGGGIYPRGWKYCVGGPCDNQCGVLEEKVNPGLYRWKDPVQSAKSKAPEEAALACESAAWAQTG